MLTDRATRWRTAGTVAISLGLILLIVAPASAATPTLTASLSANGVINGSANAGAQTTFTLSVSSDSGQLQSLSLAAPAGFFVGDVKPSSGSATVSGSSTVAPFIQTINVSGLKISGSGVLTVSITAWPNCTTPGSGTWTLNGTQKGGTAYAPHTFSTTVTQPSSCKLRFHAIPDQLTGVPFTVKVDVVRANGEIDPTYRDQVSLSVETDPGTNEEPTPLTSNSPRTPSGGTAEFSASLNVAGTGYVLEACSPTINNGPCAPVLEDGLGFLSGLFAVYDSQTPCQNNGTCSANASVAGQVSTTVSANGQAGTSVKAGVFGVPQAVPGSSDLSNLDCPGYDEITEVISSFDFDGSGIKTVVDVISAEQMKEIANQGVSFLQGCFGSSIPFRDRSGQWAPFDETLGLYVGLLPDCPTNKKNLAASAPCVVSRQGGGQGTGLFTYIAADGDPGGKRN